MSTFNNPLFDDPNQPGTIDDQPAFPELYLRNYLNDEGTLPLEKTPLVFKIEDFTATAGQTIFTVSNSPSQEFEPVAYWNFKTQYLDKSYTRADATFTFQENLISVGDIVTIRYAY